MATEIIDHYAQTSSILITGVCSDHHLRGDNSHGNNLQYHSLQTIQALHLWIFEDWYPRDNLYDFQWIEDSGDLVS